MNIIIIYLAGAFEQAVASGLQTSEDFKDIWMTFLEYLRRRLDEPDISKEDENKRLEELLANFAKAVEFLSECKLFVPVFGLIPILKVNRKEIELKN